MLSLQREKEEIKEFINHLGVYIKEKYFGVDDCGKTKGVLGSFIVVTEVSGGICAWTFGVRLKWKMEDLWWGSKTHLVDGAGVQSSGRRVLFLGRNLWALQTVFRSTTQSNPQR